MIDKPGVYQIPAEEYHADPCPAPSLSASLARTMIARSPLHAWTDHPRLNPDFKPEEKGAYDRGSAAHALLLEGEDRMRIIHADSFRGKAAQEDRDMARAVGLHPVLAEEYKNIVLMRAVALEAIANCRALKGISLKDGTAEPTLIAQRAGVWLRGRPDWMHKDRILFLDYKTTAASANPADWVRTMTGLGGEIQGAFYHMLNMATGGPEAKFVFMVQEDEPPFAVSFVGLNPEFMALGSEKVDSAILTFADCLHRQRWPAYPEDICWVEPPAWHSMKWEEGKEVRGIPYDVSKMGWERVQAQEGDPA